MLTSLIVVRVTVKLLISVVPKTVLTKSNSIHGMAAIGAVLSLGYEREGLPQPSRTGSLRADARHERQTAEKKSFRAK